MFSDKELEQLRDNDNQPLQARLLAELILQQRKMFVLLAVLPDAVNRLKSEPEPEQKPAVMIRKKGSR